MAEAPLVIIMEMIATLIKSVITTLLDIFEIFWRLVGSLLLVSSIGGASTLLLAAVVFGLVLFFLSKFLFGSVKSIIILVMAGIFILLLILIGSGVY